MSLGFAPLEMQDAVLASQRASRLALQQAQQQFGPPPRPVGDTNYAQADIPSNAQHYITAQQVANLLTKWANYAPYLSPNVAVPLARAQVDPGSPLGQSVVRTHYGMMNPMHSAVQQVDGPMRMGGSGIPQEYQGFSSGTGVPQEYQGFASPGLPDASLQDVLGATQPQQAGLLGDIGGALSSAAHGVESGIKAAAGAAAKGAQWLAGEVGQADQQATANRGALGIPNAEPDVKQAVRTGMAAMQAPYEAMQNLGAQGQIAGGPLINPTGYTPPSDQNPLDTLKATTLYQMIQGANSGKGLLPQGDAVTRAQALQREVRGAIDGHAVTPGRLLASEVVEPGTKPYNIMSGLTDAAVAFKADPTALTLKGISDYRAAQKAFDLYGVSQGARVSVDGERAGSWLDSAPGQKTLTALSGVSSTSKIKKATGWDWNVAAQVADARTPEAVRATLAPHLGLDVTQVPGPGFGWSSPLDTSRWAQLVSGRFIDAADPEQRTEQFQRFLTNGKVDAGTKDLLVHDMALAQDRTAVFTVAKRGMAQVSRVLTEQYNVPENDALKLTRMWADESEAARIYHVGAMGEVPELAGMTIDGAPVKMVGPQLPSELLNQGIPLPNARAIRQATTAWRGTLNNPLIRDTPVLGSMGRGLMSAADVATNALDGATNLWRIGIHARGALTTRILMSAQARMSAAGLDTLFTHPVDYIAAVLGTKGDAYGVPFDNAINDIAGIDQFARAMGPGYRSMQGLDAVDRARYSGYDLFSRGSSQYTKAWADELSGFYRDGTMRQVAQAVNDGSGLDAVKDAFWTSAQRDEMVRSGGWRALLSTRDASDNYVDSLANILKTKTGEQPDLIDAVANGTFGKRVGASRKFLGTLDDYAAQNIGPDVARGINPDKVMTIEGKTQKFGASLDRAANQMFKWLITIPSAKLARSETFNEYYWRELGRIFPALDENAQTALRNTISDPNSSFVPKKYLAAFAGSPTMAREGIPAVRFDQPGFDLATAASKPHGGYVNLTDRWTPDITSTHAWLADEEGAVPHTLNINPKNALRVPEMRIEHARFGRFGSGPVSAGVSALAQLTTPEEFARLRQMSKPGLVAELTQRFPGPNYSKYFDSYELMEAYGAQLARKAGYDTIIQRHIPTNLFPDAARYDEAVVLDRGAVGTSAIPLEHADMLAKTFALNETNRLLYNFSDHNQTAEAWKIVAPFGEIWKKEVLGWAKLTAEHPQVVRRGQQIVEGARGAGFFYKDPQDGQEYFTIAPAGVTQAITGLPFPIRAQVKGLNIIGQGLPGVGPAVQIPAAHLIPQTPAFDKLRQLVLPYGDPGAAEDLTNVMFPRWVDRLKESGWLYDHTGLFKPSPTQARVFGDTVKETMAYLESTGAYDMSNPESLAKLVADAKNKAQGLYLLRAGAQFVSPSAPSVAPQVKGQDGKMYEFFVMANDFRNMEQKDYKTAVPGFIAKYGQRAFLAMQPLNQRNVYGVPTTQDAQYFIAKHGGFASAFPDTYGYFVPQGGPSDPSAYQAAIDRGEINVSTPRDWLALANQRVAASIYATQRAKFPSNLTQPQSDWLAELKTKLGHDFQGYYPDQSTSGSTLSLADQIQQLDSASKSKDVQGAAVTGPVRDYLAVRDEVYAQLHQAFGASATLNRKDATNAKAWLLSVGADIANRHPEFQPVWDQLLSREVG